MNDSPIKTILATCAADDFIGRQNELDALRRHAGGETRSRALLLLSTPTAGASELLKQFYDRIFLENSDLVPFYFAVRESDKTAKMCAERFLQTFIAQVVAFRRRESKILEVSPDIDELSELAAPEDAEWLNRLSGVFQNEKSSKDELAFVRSCLSAPLRAYASGVKLLVLIDDLHETDFLAGGAAFVNELKEIFSRSGVSVVLAGRRRFLLSAARTGSASLSSAEIVKIEQLKFSDGGLLAENLANQFQLGINDQTRDLIVRQFDGNPGLIKFLWQAANERQIDLDSFQKVEQVYTDELFGGRIGKFYDAAFQRIAPNVETQANIIKLLFEAQADEAEHKHFDGAEFQKAIGTAAGAETFQLTRLLNWHEIISLSANRIEASSANEVLNDYIQARFRLEIAADTRAATVGEMFSGFLKRAPQTMAKFYRQQSAIGLRRILSAFDCQEMPARLLDYAAYKNAAGAAETVVLPQIIYTAQTSAFYPAFSRVVEDERSAVALGFDTRAYTESDETVWIAAEIDSKLEASAELTEFWCDRLEMVALTGNFLQYKLWLVAPEGFTADAIEVLRRRNAYGSSRRQVEELKQFLQAVPPNAKPAASEYEMIMPMGGDTELIAANAVEEIARRHYFEPKAINQIKTALVEACINANEHSLSPDRKINLKFAVETDKLTIAVANRGLRLIDKNPEESAAAEKRRGWGLKLMRSLMDEVRVEPVDDGTRILLTKLIKPETRTR